MLSPTPGGSMADNPICPHCARPHAVEKNDGQGYYLTDPSYKMRTPKVQLSVSEQILEDIKHDLRNIQINVHAANVQPPETFSTLLVLCLCCVNHTEEPERYNRAMEVADLLHNNWLSLKPKCLKTNQLNVITGLTTARDTLRHLFRKPQCKKSDEFRVVMQ